jgi:L-cysteine:1D-myo-inositol 2-amino-2-deoxy-alpha-D-glucopyranoside ligase
MVIRLAILSNHYRSSWEWDSELLVQAQERLNRWKKNDKKEAGLSEVGACLDNDLDTQSALKEIDRISRAGNNVSEAASLLGIFW